jgi:hypothetical protein
MATRFSPVLISEGIPIITQLSFYRCYFLF